MSFVEAAAKIAYERLCKPFLKRLEDPPAAQEECLLKILKRCKGTVFGKRHGFADIKTIEEYQRRVPVSTYEDMEPYIARCMKGEQNILFPDRIMYFVQSSGTTADRKYYPLGEYRARQHGSEIIRRRLFYTVHGNYYDLGDGATVTLHEPPLSGDKCGIYDVINGTHVATMELQTQRFGGSRAVEDRLTIPPPEVIALRDWEEKTYLAARHAVAADVRRIIGVSSLMSSFLRKISLHFYDRLMADPELDNRTKNRLQRVSKNGVINLSELWPNFTIFCGGGVSITPYRRIIRNLLGDIEIWNIYGAIEATMGDQLYPNGGIVPAIDLTFLEFQPEGKDTEPVPLSDVKINTPYRVLVTNHAGFYRYELGDIVTLAALDPPEYGEITRLKTLVNIVGERTREEMLLRALDHACEKQHTTYTEFALLPEVTTTITRYQLFIEFTQIPTDLEKLANDIDTHLRSLGIYYDYFRQNGTLSPPHIVPVKPGGFQTLLQKLGKDPLHSKVPRILTPQTSQLIPQSTA